jgi:hypothetical protein
MIRDNDPFDTKLHRLECVFRPQNTFQVNWHIARKLLYPGDLFPLQGCVDLICYIRSQSRLGTFISFVVPLPLYFGGIACVEIRQAQSSRK